jgi:hypothetical protein
MYLHQPSITPRRVSAVASLMILVSIVVGGAAALATLVPLS